MGRPEASHTHNMNRGRPWPTVPKWVCDRRVSRLAQGRLLLLYSLPNQSLAAADAPYTAIRWRRGTSHGEGPLPTCGLHTMRTRCVRYVRPSSPAAAAALRTCRCATERGIQLCIVTCSESRGSARVCFATLRVPTTLLPIDDSSLFLSLSPHLCLHPRFHLSHGSLLLLVLFSAAGQLKVAVETAAAAVEAALSPTELHAHRRREWALRAAGWHDERAGVCLRQLGWRR